MRLLVLLSALAAASGFMVMSPPRAHVSAQRPLATVGTVGLVGRTGGAFASRRQGSIAMAMERTYIMIKPDGVQRGLVGDIIGRFERRGFKLVGLKLTQPTRALLEEHYSSLKEKPFFPKLMGYMLSGPVVAMVWEGKDGKPRH
jgi:hypothetical protein